MEENIDKGGSPGRDTKIEMIVDTTNIKPGEENKWIEFEDDRGNSRPSKDVVNFTSEISPGKTVFWSGKPKDGGPDRIEIISIEKKREDEPEFLEEMCRNLRYGNFKAKVITTYTEGVESYIIKFRIKGRDSEYVVDPKLTMATVR